MALSSKFSVLDEDFVNQKIVLESQRYERKYDKYFKSLEEKSLLSKVKKITDFDRWGLGKMLESVDYMLKVCESNGTVSDLGLLPRIARDVVTIAYGTSPMPLIASIQPQDEEIGIVYYKAVTAVNGGGNITAGDKIASALGDWKTPSGFANAERTEIIGTGNGTTVAFTATLTFRPIRPGTVVITAGSVTGKDYNQDGKILGDGILSGTIDYQTGAVSIQFDTAPATNVTVAVDYWANVEDISMGLREINYELLSTVVRARIYVLKGVTGLFKAYAMQKRFGMAAEEELAVDLVNALNSELLGDMILKMKQAAPSTVTWDATTPTGTNYFEHKQTFKDALAGAEQAIVTQAKRGAISFIIAGAKVAGVMRTLFGWETVYEGHGMGVGHLFGKLDGIPVIRVTDTNVLDATKAIIGYKGPGAFEAPAVQCPYMPVTVTSVLPTASPIIQQRAAACWVAQEVLVPRFLCNLSITGTLPYGQI